MRDKLGRMVRDTYLVFRYAAKQHGADRVNRMSAAVAYRGLFAMAPLLILAVYVVGLVVGSEAARAEILEAINRVAGPTVVDAVDTILATMADPGAAAGVVGLVLLLWTSSGLFLELQNDLNDIFDVPYEQTSGILGTVRKRGLGFLWALALGLILILVLLLNNIWEFLGSLLPDTFEPVHRVVSFLTPLVSVVVLPFVIALFVQTLSQVKIRWRAIWWGSLFTTVAFLLTSYGVSLYFRFSSTSAAQIAGAVFVILLAAYTFATVFLFGAEVTKASELYLETGTPPGDATADPLVSDRHIQ